MRRESDLHEYRGKSKSQQSALQIANKIIGFSQEISQPPRSFKTIKRNDKVAQSQRVAYAQIIQS